MTCEHVTLPGGQRAIVCSQTRRCKCGNRATLECDWKVPTRRSGTCDAAICATCATSPAPDKDLCPKHAEEFERWKAARPLLVFAPGVRAGSGADHQVDPLPASEFRSETHHA